MSHPHPPRIVRTAPDASGEIEVMQFGAEGESDDEAMFEFDDDEEAEVYLNAQKKLAVELSAKAAAAAAPSAAAAAAAPAADANGVGGMATVVQINIVPNMAAGSAAAAAGASPAEPVNVGVSVIERFVPHLNAHKTEGTEQPAAATSLPQSGNITSADLAATAPMTAATSSAAPRNDGDDSDDESAAADADASGADLVLTGDLDVDQNTLATLMAGKDAAMSGEAEGAAEDAESSSEDEDDEEDIALRREAAKLEDIGSDEEPDVASGIKGVYTKNEVKPSEMAAPAEFIVPASEQLRAVGRIRSVVDRVMVVMSSRPALGIARAPALDIGSAICLANRHPVGRVEEVFGLVSEPFYSVRLLASMDPALLPQPAPVADDSDDDEAEEKASEENAADLVYCIPGLSSFAAADKRPGTDASNMHDEEVAEDEQEFSDDEKEMEAKAAKRAASRKTMQEKRATAAAATDGAAPGAIPTGRTFIKAKRNNRESGGGSEGGAGGSGNRPSPSKPTSNPAAAPLMPQHPVVAAAASAAASKHAPLLPMPGTQPQSMQQQHLLQPFNPYANPYYPAPQQPGAAYPMYAAGVAPPQAFAGYPPQQQQQMPNPYAAYYAQPQQPYGYPPQPYAQAYPQQQQAAAPGAVAGGFAGWGAQNLAGAAPAPGAYYPPYAGYANPYAQQQQQPPQQSDAPPPAAP